MKLWLVRRHWEKFARTDPLWAVLTWPGKAGNRWDQEEFFATGRATITAELARVRTFAPALRFGHALDFGCGVGRLTQPLAEHFQQVTGVDISAHMLALARRHNRHGTRVAYVHNPRSDLACFADGTFDFIYSFLTLQHVAPHYARRYIDEFVRVLAPGGLALFQMPAREPPPRVRPVLPWPSAIALRVYRAFNRFGAMNPSMEMHAMPRDEVVALVQGLGAEVLDVHRYDAGETLESYGYLIRNLRRET